MDFNWLEVYLIMKGDAIRGTMNTIFWVMLIVSVITYLVSGVYAGIFEDSPRPSDENKALSRKFLIAANKMIIISIFFLVFRIIFPNSTDIAGMLGLKAIDDGQFLLENRYTAGILKDKFGDIVVEPEKSEYMKYANNVIDSLNSEIAVKDSVNSILMLRLQMENINLDSIMVDVEKFVLTKD
jgi:hypothetical protein